MVCLEDSLNYVSKGIRKLYSYSSRMGLSSTSKMVVGYRLWVARREKAMKQEAWTKVVQLLIDKGADLESKSSG